MTGTQQGRTGSGVIVILGLGALAIIALGLRSCLINLPGVPFMNSHSMLNSFAWFGPMGLFGIGGLIQIGLAIWVGMDAERRGMNGWLWGLLVLFTFIVGLIVYLIVGQTMGPRPGGSTFARIDSPFGRTPPPAANEPPTTRGTGSCDTCHAEVLEGYKICPQCGHSLRCRECSEVLQASWKLCPQCGTTIPGRASS